MLYNSAAGYWRQISVWPTSLSAAAMGGCLQGRTAAGSTEASNRAKEKENDLKYFESGMQFLDRSKPYSDNSRKFGITRWLHGLGLPAGSQENKDLTGLLTKADDAELEVIRRTIATAAPHLSRSNSVM